MRLAAATSIVFLLTPGSCLFADSILSTSCRIGFVDGTEIAVNSTGTCNVVGPPEPYRDSSYAWALAETLYRLEPPDYHLPEGSYRFATVARTLAIYNDRPGDPFSEAYAMASAYAELDLRATTAGPMRPGLIDLFSFVADSSWGNQTFYVQARIGDLFREGQYEGNCGGPCTGTFPFVLGQAFDIQALAFSQSWSGDPDVVSANDILLALRFRLRELDGTPVYLSFNTEPVSPVPEPSTLLLVAPALSLLLLLPVIGRYLRPRRGQSSLSS
jgi:hypothetical protein